MLPIDSEDLLFRIKGGVQLEGVINKTDEEGIKAAFQEAINELISKVNSKAFIISGGPIFMWPKIHTSTHQSELQDDTQCKAILKYIAVEVSEILKKASKKKSLKIVPLKVINLKVHFELATLDRVENVIIQHNKMSRIHFKLTLPIDVVLFADPADPWGKIQDQFVDAIITQLSAMDKCIQRYTNGKTVPMPQAFHFELPEKTTLTTVIYPAGISDETLEPQRKELHALLGLDNKPFFRRSMAFCFPSDEMKAKYLRNVHKYIPTLNPDEFQIFGVHGSYIFHHCMQDNENDAEWGALYRCFQVIISWFNCQGYINKPTPMVTEMQDILTKFDEGFVNVVEEKDWIPLEQMVAILNAFSISTTTKDIRPEVDEPIDLSIHFKEQGTPVAFTAESTACVVLGIAVNEEANIKKLLVLDTGYTGNDDLASITEKAVDWKDEEFLMGLEAYGICLPQRPDGV